MSNFRKLSVYQKSRNLNKDVFLFMKTIRLERVIRDQLSRASMSIMLNIAEGAGRFSKKDQRNFYVIARSSAMECIAIFDVIEDLELLSDERSSVFRERFSEITRMTFGMG